MEQEYEELKGEVGSIFSNVKKIVFSMPGIEESKIEMNLKIIRAVVMRFIRMIMYGKHPGILCTSTTEVITYVTNGFLKHIPQEDKKDRQKVIGYAKELQGILEKKVK